MATISASPRVAPLRWAHLPVVGVTRRPVVADTVSVRQETSADVINWRLIGWIVAVFLGTLAFSGLLAQAFRSGAVGGDDLRAGPAGPPRPPLIRRTRWLLATPCGASHGKRRPPVIRGQRSGRSVNSTVCRTATCCRPGRC